jgi:hypothetical protein
MSNIPYLSQLDENSSVTARDLAAMASAIANTPIYTPAYKVYTALLTQTGGDDPLFLLSQDAPSLTIGVTYEIYDDGGSGWDFTNVGAPNNDLGTYFIATGITPSNWGTNGMLKYNTGAPVVTVLENTIGNIWFTYTDVGVYYLNSSNLFTIDKTYSINSQTKCFNTSAINYNLYLTSYETGYVEINTSNNTFINANGGLLNKMIEVRVYN